MSTAVGKKRIRTTNNDFFHTIFNGIEGIFQFWNHSSMKNTLFAPLDEGGTIKRGDYGIRVRNIFKDAR